MTALARGTRTVHALQAHQGDALWFLDALVVVKQGAEHGSDTGVLDYQMSRGSETPLHCHAQEDEAVYILEGKLRVLVGEQTIDVAAGAYARLPAGVPHALIALSDARFLVFANANGFIGLVQEMGEPAPAHVFPPAREPDLPRLLALTQKYQIEVLGPAPRQALL